MRVRTWWNSWGPAMLASVMWVLAVFGVSGGKLQQAGTLAVIGALYGLAVLGLIRLLQPRRWGYLIAGLLAGPVPAAVLVMPMSEKSDDRAGLWVAAALLGLAIGLMEWGRSGQE